MDRDSLNTLVNLMSQKEGWAYTTGYLQSMLMSASYGLSKRSQQLLENDIKNQLQKLQKSA